MGHVGKGGFIAWLKNQADNAYKGNWIADLGDDLADGKYCPATNTARGLANAILDYGVSNEVIAALNMAYQEYVGDRHVRLTPCWLSSKICHACKDPLSECFYDTVIYLTWDENDQFCHALEREDWGYLHRGCVGYHIDPAFRYVNLSHFVREPFKREWRDRLPGGLWDAIYAFWTEPPDSAKPLPPSLRFAILKRDAYRCRLCGAAARDGAHVRLEVDHIIPRADSGTNDEANLWTLCLDCNRGKSKEPL